MTTHIKNSTTNSMILDYLFYQSIQSRLQKAFVQDEIISDKNAIESVIDGIFYSRKKKISFIHAKGVFFFARHIIIKSWKEKGCQI